MKKVIAVLLVMVTLPAYALPTVEEYNAEITKISSAIEQAQARLNYLIGQRDLLVLIQNEDKLLPTDEEGLPPDKAQEPEGGDNAAESK